MRRRDLLTTALAATTAACLPAAHRRRLRGPTDEPPRTVFLPDHGTDHDAGTLQEDLGIAWYPRWRVRSADRGIVLRTTPSLLEGGAWTALVQLGHAHPGGAPLTLRARTATRLLAELQVEAQPYLDAQSGGYQRVLLPFLAPGTEPVWLEGEHTEPEALWIGAVALHPTAPRPFYNVAHRCNWRARLEQAIRQGANAIEADVSPVLQGGNVELGLYHVGDLLHTPAGRLDPWLADAAAHLHADRLAMLMLDCKLRAGVGIPRYAHALVTALRRAGLPADRVAVSLPAEAARPMLDLLHEALDYPCAVDIYQSLYDEADQQRWPALADQLGANFLGVGLDSAAFWSPMPVWTHWLQALANYRDAGHGVSKVYYWTIDAPRSMRKCLDLTMDGIITNDPGALTRLLCEPPYDRLYRLATRNDPLTARHRPARASEDGDDERSPD
jgi:glycerophosphoryl diester phosphodiesterase